MQKIKAIAGRYKIQKPLFKVNSYLYAKLFDKFTLDSVIGCVYVYENQQPGQILKMLLEKFTLAHRMPNLIFPTSHIKDSTYDKSVSIFFMGQNLMPIQLFTELEYATIDVNQMLKFAYDAFCSLHYLHSHDILHGNISLTTVYISKNEKQMDLALNILDTSTFHEQLLKSHQSLIFKSQSQQNGLKTSYKDDAQCIIYVLLHLLSKGKMLSKQRYYQEWMNQNELLRWKTMDFFKQMVEILPHQLEFLTQIFTIIKSLSRNQKPDYPKFIKKTYSKLKQKQNFDMKQINRQMLSGLFSLQKFPTIQFEKKTSDKQKNSKKVQQKNFVQQVTSVNQQQQILLKIDSDQEENELVNKFSKLQSTKCTTKTKGFWNQKVINS